MSVSNYKYTADSGTVYQVTLPDDFAQALGETPATGSESYLPQEISPRYANYRSAAGVLRTAIITTSTIFGALPNPLTVAGVSYKLGNAQGESTLPYLPAFNMAAMGPQGAQGPAGQPGTIPFTVTQLSASQIANLGTTAVTVVPAQGANTIAQFAFALIRNKGGSAAWTNSGQIGFFLGSSTVALGGATNLYESLTPWNNLCEPQNSWNNNDANVVNQPITMKAQFTVTGSGTLTWEVVTYYTVINVP